MSYFNYHSVAKKLIADGKLKRWYISENHNGISPALVLEFDDVRHPIMPVRQHRWQEYFKMFEEMEKTQPHV